jgi:hypothetical protein
MTIDWMLVATIGGPLLALPVGAALDRFLERRPKLITYLGHVSSFRIQGPPIADVFTHSIVVRNAGGRAATNVRIGHNTLPQNFQIFPPVEFRVVNHPNGAADIVIGTLAPGEQITISYLYFPPLTWAGINTTVICDDGFAKVLNVLPTPQLPKWALWVLKFFIYLGLVTFLYLLVQLGILLWQSRG